MSRKMVVLLVPRTGTTVRTYPFTYCTLFPLPTIVFIRVLVVSSAIYDRHQRIFSERRRAGLARTRGPSTKLTHHWLGLEKLLSKDKNELLRLRVSNF